MTTETSGADESFIDPPTHTIAYLAVAGALVSAGIHLLLAGRVMGFSQTLGILFYLNGAGWIGGLLLFFSRYWRRQLYLVAAGYAAVTIVLFFVMSGRVGQLSITAKVAEAVVAIVTGYIYFSSGPD